MVQFLFFRHGETDWNLGKRFQGHTDIPLNETGRSQARALAEKVRFWKPEIILSSDLIRAFETAQLGSVYWQVPIIKSANLREMHLGQAEGLHREKVQDLVGEKFNEFISSDLKFEDFRFPEGESKKEAKHRVLSFLESYVQQNPNIRRIAVSTHGGILKRVTSSLSDVGSEGVPIPNCVTYRLNLEPHRKQWSFIKPRERSSVLIHDQNHYLAIEAQDPVSARKYLFLPGGKVDLNETPREAADREAKEEAGALVKAWGEDSVYQEYDFLWAGQDYWSRTHFHHGELDQMTPHLKRSAEESYLGNLKWLKAAELLKHYEDFPAIRYAIQNLAKS